MLWKILTWTQKLLELAFVLSFVAFIAMPVGTELKQELAVVFCACAVLWVGIFSAKKWKYSEELHYGKSVIDSLSGSDDD